MPREMETEDDALTQQLQRAHFFKKTRRGKVRAMPYPTAPATGRASLTYDPFLCLPSGYPIS